MNPEAQTALIDRYLRGALSEAERLAFEARCRQEPAFAEAVRAHSLAEYAVRLEAQATRRARLQAEWEAAPPARVRRLRPVAWVSAAAAVILLLLLLWPRPEPGLRTLYAAYPISESFSHVRGESPSPEDAAWTAAGDAYATGDYAQALQALEAGLADSTLSDRGKAQFFRGLCYLQLPAGHPLPEADRLDQVEAALAAVPEASSYYEPALWYRALARLRAEDAPGARDALQRILAYPSHYRQAAAQDLLDQMEAR